MGKAWCTVQKQGINIYFQEVDDVGTYGDRIVRVIRIDSNNNVVMRHDGSDRFTTSGIACQQTHGHTLLAARH